MREREKNNKFSLIRMREMGRPDCLKPKLSNCDVTGSDPTGIFTLQFSIICTIRFHNKQVSKCRFQIGS